MHSASYRVLWIDDDQLFVANALGVISSLKPILDVAIAHNFADAKSLIAKNDFDVVVVDLDLGIDGTRGEELISLCRARDPAIQAIVISSHDQTSTVARCIQAGASDFSGKLAGPQEFHLRIVRAGERRLRQLQDEERHQFAKDQATVVALSPSMRKIVQDAEQLGVTPNLNVLIRGETGVGKDVVAQYLNHCAGASRAFVSVNCAAIPESLLEATFFGYEKGAFTGAMTTRAGKFEIAHGGDIFLDEIATLSPAMQAKFLRVIETGEVERLGTHQTRQVKFRVIAATNEPIEQMIQQGRFRQDLYERLCGFEINIPPLRERRADLEKLIDQFVREHGDFSMTPELMKILLSYSWPGNVRELRQVIALMTTLSRGSVVGPALLPQKILASMSAGIPAGGEFQFRWTLDGGLKQAEDRFFAEFIQIALGQLKKPSLRSLSELVKVPKSTLAERLKAAGLDYKE